MAWVSHWGHVSIWKEQVKMTTNIWITYFYFCLGVCIWLSVWLPVSVFWISVTMWVCVFLWVLLSLNFWLCLWGHLFLRLVACDSVVEEVSLYVWSCVCLCLSMSVTGWLYALSQISTIFGTRDSIRNDLYGGVLNSLFWFVEIHKLHQSSNHHFQVAYIVRILVLLMSSRFTCYEICRANKW